MRPTLLFALLAFTAATPALAQTPASTVVILVRHAERAPEPRNDPGLSPAGDARARALAAALADARLDGIVTTQYLRTRATAEPVATAQGITPDVVQTAGGTPAHVQAVAEHVRQRYAGKTVLVVGHSNTIPAIATALGAPPLPDLNDAEFSTMFVVGIRPNGTVSLIRTAYGARDNVVTR